MAGLERTGTFGGMVSRWQPTRRSDVFDVALAALLGALAGVSLYVGGDEALTGDLADYSRALGVVTIVVLHLAVAVRRRFPLSALLVGTAAFAPLRLADIPEFDVASVSLFVLLYTAGAYGRTGRDAVRGLVALVIAALVVEAIFQGGPMPYEGRVPLEVINLFTAVINATYLAAAWMLGDHARHRREREAQLEAQARALAAAQDDLARRAVLGERVRIARELHDVLAHHVSVMGVQAAAARRVLGSRPEAVPELLSSIEGSSRDAVEELQRLLGLLRQEDDVDDTSPHPTLDELPALAEQMRDAGLAVELELDPAPQGGPLPAGVELSAFRIVQEALTNTLKHAGPGARAAVRVERRPSSLELCVVDDGTTAGGKGASGHGLLGMRERVTLHGGELKVGRRKGGGFEVRAWFPLRATS